MKRQPTAMKTMTMATLMVTMMPLTTADSWVPLIRIRVIIARTIKAGTLMMPCSSGPWHHSYGMRPPSSLLMYSLQAIDTVAAPSAYSSTSAHPMIHAVNSPMVVYAYVYALPAMGIIAENSA